MRPLFSLTPIAGLLISSVAFAAPPTEPGNLTADVYSDTAAELFWSRSEDSDGFVRGYEIRRNGDLVTTIDALSYFTDDLTPGEVNTFTVTAVDFNDEQSTAASVTVSTGANSMVVSPQEPLSPLELPEETTAGNDTFPQIRPQGLSIEVYSASSAELFWMGNTATPNLSSFEIRRDGVLIDTVFSRFTRSYLDSTREPNVRYVYDVTAVADATAVATGGRATASITGPGFNPSSAASVNPVDSDLPEATMQRLETILSIVNGEADEKAVASFLRLADRDFREDAGFEMIGSGIDQTSSQPYILYSCPNGGDIVDFQAVDSEIDFSISAEFIATMCKVGPITSSGEFEIPGGLNFGSGLEPTPIIKSVLITFGSIEDDRDGSTYQFERLRFDEGSTEFISSTNHLSSEFSQPGVAWTIDGWIEIDGADNENRLPDGSVGTTLSAINGEVRISGIFDEPASFLTLGPIEFSNGRELGRPSAGRLFSGTDNQSLLLNFFNGDADSFTLTETDGGVTTSYTVPFDEQIRIENANPQDADIGF